MIVSEGKVSTGLHFIEQGTIEVLSKDARIALLTASDFFGEDSLLEMIEVSAKSKEKSVSLSTFRTITYCDILILTNESFSRVLDQHGVNRHNQDLRLAVLDSATTRNNRCALSPFLWLLASMTTTRYAL